MLNNQTIRFRVSLMSLLIMTISVLTILFGYFVLQSQNQQKVLFYPEDMKTIQSGDDESVQPVITKVQQRYEEHQTKLLMQMIVLSGSVLLFGSALIYYVIKRELHTLEELKNELKVIDFQKENNLLKIETRNEEMRTLIDTFNDMMKKLQHAYFLQKRFAQNAAHELKTPVTVMMTNIQVEKMTNQHINETMPLLDVLEKQVLRLSSLIEGLLRLNNQADLLNKKVNVQDMVDSILKNQLTQIHEKNLTIQVSGELVLDTDEDYLYGILRNVIDNAIQYNVKDGSINIMLTKSSIIIEDTGIGIPKDSLLDVFSPFYCVDDSRTKLYGGYGLGLSIVESYLKKLKFTYNVESEVNKGTVFKLGW